MKRYIITYESAYGYDHATVWAQNKTVARMRFNANKPIAGCKIVEIEEA